MSYRFRAKLSGEQVVTLADDGRIVVEFSYRDNGRGPDIHEEMRLDSAGRFVWYRATGKSTYAAPIDETFEFANGSAHWKSLADRGEQSGELSGQYVPVENSFETIAVIARALLRQRGWKACGAAGGPAVDPPGA